MLRYNQMDQVSQERIKNAVAYTKDKPKGFAKPESKELTISADGIEFKVVLKISAKLPVIWRDYYLQKETGKFFDPEEALRKAQHSDCYFDDGSGAYMTMPLENCIPENTTVLTPEQVDTRLRVFVTVANMCAQLDVAAKILNLMPKKKNKTLYKGRKQDIAFLNIVNQGGWTYQLVAKNESDTQLCIELRNKVPVVNDLVDCPTDMLQGSDILF